MPKSCDCRAGQIDLVKVSFHGSNFKRRRFHLPRGKSYKVVTFRKDGLLSLIHRREFTVRREVLTRRRDARNAEVEHPANRASNRSLEEKSSAWIYAGRCSRASARSISRWIRRRTWSLIASSLRSDINALRSAC